MFIYRQAVAISCLLLAMQNIATADEGKVDYLKQIKQIFAARCYSCHGALKQESMLRLDTAALMQKGGENGAAIRPGNIAKSPLIERITSTDEFERMPPEGKPLTPRQIASITAWIKQGAVAPADEKPEKDPKRYWSFIKPIRQKVPAVKNQAWVRNPIDAFIAARHEDLKVTPQPPATKAAMLRRVSIDLSGIPPTRQQLHEFLADDSPDAYEKVVDRLLDSPQYGERWGRHWMDVWRYSDWYGRRSVNDVRNSYPHIWRWRDWIVRSLNEDKGYDQMVREMLAADEIAPEDDETIAALGFIVRNWFSLNYETWKQDLVEHTGKAFLGLRFNCAHCHDHKYDPILQKEYFQFRAFFEPLELRHDRVPGGPALTRYLRYKPGSSSSLKPIAAGLPRVYDHYFDQKTFMYQLGDPRNRFERPPVEPGVPPFLGGPKIEVAKIDLPPVASYPGLKPFVQNEETARREKAVQAAHSEVAQASDGLPELRKAKQTAETRLAQLRAQAKAHADSHPATPATARETKVIGHWRFEGEDSANGFLSDSSGNSHTLSRVTANDPPAELFALGKTSAGKQFFNPTPIGGLTNRQAARFQQSTSYAYLAAEGGPVFHADQFTLEACVHFEISTSNFNRTVAALDGSWTLLHRGLDAKTFELRLLCYNPQGELRDVATATGKQPLVLKTGQDYFVAVTLDAANITFYAKELSKAGDFVSRSFPRNTEGKDFSKLASPQAGAKFKIGNSDGTGRVVGLIDEVRYAAEAASSVEIAAASASSPNDELRRAVATAVANLQSVSEKLVTAEGKLPVAKAKLAAATAGLNAIEARIAADRAKYLKAGDDPQQSALAAANSERLASLVTARLKQVQAEQSLQQAKAVAKPDPKKLKQAETALTAANKVVAAAEKTIANKTANYTPLSPTYPTASSGRRRALANWISSKDNPLTARVAVNHIWMRHFGRPIVESVFDFGRSGKLPTHPQLIDWLANELMQPSVGEPTAKPWSMKHIHRLIVTSNTYRMNSNAPADSPNLANDKDNSSWWHFEPQRMQAEVVRDSVLHLAGTLDAKMGGQELDPKLEATTYRRSLYYAMYPEGGGIMKFMATFDPADPIDCYRRKRSIVPQQALALSNSQLAIHQGRLLARNLSAEIKSVGGEATAQQTAFITAAFEQILTRPPTDKERQFCNEFLQRQTALYAQSKQKPGTPPKGVTTASTDPKMRARESLVRVLLNHNDFVTIH